MATFVYRHIHTNQMVYVPTLEFAGDPDWELISGGGSGGDATVVQADLNSHKGATTSVHGIFNTALLETTAGSQAKADAAASASIPLIQKGAASGVATLDGSSKLTGAQLPAISASNITTGTLPVGQIPGLPGSAVTSGTVAYARLPVGTTASTVAAGDATTTALNMKVAKGELVFNVADYGAVSDGATSDLTAIQNAIAAAAAVGGTVMLKGDHAVAGIIDLAAGVTLDGTQGSLTQTTNLTATVRVNSVSDVTIRNVKITGVGSDYVNTSTVYLAAGISIAGTSTRVVVDGCVVTGVAGAGVIVGPSVSIVSIRDCRITGPGAPPIVGTTSNFGGGIVFNAGGTADVEISGCDISQYAQGIVTGDCSQMRIVGNYVHDIVGQHGVYLDSVIDLVFADNMIRNTVLQGVKIQLALGGTPDTTQVSITGNVITNAGSHALLLTRLSGTPRLRRVAVVGNTFSTAGLGGDGINCIGVAGAVLANNTIFTARAGISLNTCTGLTITGNRIESVTAQGIFVTSSSDIQIVQNRITDPATGDDPTSEFGIYLTGAGTAAVTVDGNTVSDSGGKMKYALYAVTTIDQSTLVVRNNDFTGATDYAVRLDSAQAIKEWANNFGSGSIGKVTGFPSALIVKGEPTQYLGTAPPVSGAYLRGDVLWNTTPSGTNPGWVCTVAGTPGTWTNIATSENSPNVQIFTASGTWTKPAGAQVVEVTTVGGGGGGGSGRRGAAASIRCGGGGGGASGVVTRKLLGSDLGSTVTVTIGNGGPGGAAVTADDTSGNAGTQGGATSFGTFVGSTVGFGGAGGTATTGTGGVGSGGMFAAGQAGAGVSASVTGGAGVVAATSNWGGGGGPSGGGITNGGGAGDVAGNGANGAGTQYGASTGFGTGGVVDSTTPTQGTAPVVGTPGPSPGSGAASKTTAAQAGGSALANTGAGGAGGGASLNGNNSGAGGNGGSGVAVIITYL